jgi:hypothetical protein
MHSLHGTSWVRPLSTIVHSFLYFVRQTSYRKLIPYGGFVYNVALVRQLCADIAAEQDPARVSELADLLQAVVREDQDEIRLRMAFLKKKYADVIEAKAAD